MAENKTVLQTWIEVSDQIFVGWEEQTIWNLWKNVWGEQSSMFLVQMFTNGLPWNDIVETHWQVKKKKKVLRTDIWRCKVSWDMKGLLTIHFSGKGETVNGASYHQLLRQYSLVVNINNKMTETVIKMYLVIHLCQVWSLGLTKVRTYCCF